MSLFDNYSLLRGRDPFNVAQRTMPREYNGELGVTLAVWECLAHVCTRAPLQSDVTRSFISHSQRALHSAIHSHCACALGCHHARYIDCPLLQQPSYGTFDQTHAITTTKNLIGLRLR